MKMTEAQYTRIMQLATELQLAIEVTDLPWGENGERADNEYSHIVAQIEEFKILHRRENSK